MHRAKRLVSKSDHWSTQHSGPTGHLDSTSKRVYGQPSLCCESRQTANQVSRPTGNQGFRKEPLQSAPTQAAARGLQGQRYGHCIRAQQEMLLRLSRPTRPAGTHGQTARAQQHWGLAQEQRQRTLWAVAQGWQTLGCSLRHLNNTVEALWTICACKSGIHIL